MKKIYQISAVLAVSGFLTLASSFCSSAKAASLTYSFNRFLGNGSALGTITTNGSLGDITVDSGITPPFFKDWNIVLTVGSSSATLTPLNSEWLERGLINATPDELTLNLLPVSSISNDAVFQLTQVIENRQVNVYSWQNVPRNRVPLSEQIFVFGKHTFNSNAPSSYKLKAMIPEPEPMAVPEPSSILGLFVMSALGAGTVLKRKLNSKS